MRALYLYFNDTTAPDHEPSRTTAGAGDLGDRPLTPIRPGAFARWMASRGRAAAEGTASAAYGPLSAWRPGEDRLTSRS